MLFAHETGGLRVEQQAPRAHMFAIERNTATAIALAFVCFSLVPFIGILFSPFAIVMGGVGLFKAWSTPGTGGARLAVCCIVFGFLIAGGQQILWWYF
jgi:hypothetical protein